MEGCCCCCAAKKSSVFDRLGSESSTPGNSPKTGSQGDSSVFSRLGGKPGLKRAASNSPDDSDDDSPQSPLGYHGILKFSSSAKKSSPTVPRKKIRVTVEEPVQIVEKFKVTGLDKVKVTGLDQLKVGAKSDVFDSSDIQPLKVQVSSTTSNPKPSIKQRKASVPVSSSVENKLRSAKMLSIQKQEVSTTTVLTKTQGVLSMDAPTQSASVKSRLGNKASVQKVPASSTTSGFGPSTKKTAVSDVRSRLGAKTSAKKLSASTTSQPKTTVSSGVFGRLGKKTIAS